MNHSFHSIPTEPTSIISSITDILNSICSDKGSSGQEQCFVPCGHSMGEYSAQSIVGVQLIFAE